MNPAIQHHFDKVLGHLYINPLEKCNLKCKICYTRKTAPILSNDDILNFVERYQQEHPVKTITFCGGEVFALAAFPTLVNTLLDQDIFIQVITNGTLDQLDKLKNPNFVQLIVSLDGVAEYHDANRGEGMFKKSTAFMKKAHGLGFHTHVFSILTHQNLSRVDEFEAALFQELGYMPEVTYHPRKPPTYLMHHPVSNIVGETDGFDFLTQEEMEKVIRTRNVFPPKDLGCYQVALMSDGKVYGCCEGITPIGMIDDPPADLIAALKTRLRQWEATNILQGCLGCSQPDFVCGIKHHLLALYKEQGLLLESI
jgi:MoaA/NifB/PqqE/SkfB family radical SAM enzyme